LAWKKCQKFWRKKSKTFGGKNVKTFGGKDWQKISGKIMSKCLADKNVKMRKNGNFSYL
jgi:hypothetical protein